MNHNVYISDKVHTQDSYFSDFGNYFKYNRKSSNC